MARRTITICDGCGTEMDNAAAIMRANPTDGRAKAKAAELCQGCFDNLPGVSAARRGRKPAPEATLQAV